MRISIWYECDLSGGADWFLIDLLNSWPGRNDKFTLFVNEDHEGVLVLLRYLPRSVKVAVVSNIFPRVWVRKIKKFPIDKIVGKTVGRSLKKFLIGIVRLMFVPKQIFKILLLFKNNPTDCIVLNNGGYPGGLTNIWALLLAYLFHIPSRFMIVHNFPVNFVSRILLDWECRKMLTGMITVSHAVEKEILRERIVSKDKLHVIHNGISFRPQNGSQEFERHPSCQYIGIIGTLEERKGHSILFQAFSTLQADYPGLRIVIVGSDHINRKANLLDLAKVLGISKSLIWLGYTASVFDIMKKLDILVVPSIAFESFGRVIVEAMAYKIPVIASRLGGMPEIVRDNENGLLFTPGSSDELALCIRRLLNDPALAKKLSEEGYKTFINNFQANIMATRYYNLLHGKS